jgi:ankyrin repeat protein
MCCMHQYGNTPLSNSVRDGNLEMCKLLIDNGALPSINTPNKVNIYVYYNISDICV